MITAMTTFLLFTVVIVLAAALAVLRDIHHDDPRRLSTYRPPQSHPSDPFGRSGHSFR